MSIQGLLFVRGFWCDPGKVAQVHVQTNRTDHAYHVRCLRAGSILVGVCPSSLGEDAGEPAHAKHRDEDAGEAKDGCN